MRNRLFFLLFLLFSLGTVQGQTLSLDSCLTLALQNNTQVQNAKLSVAAAQEVKRQAFTKYFPQIFGMAGGYYAQNPLLEIGVNDVENSAVRDMLNLFYYEYGSALGLPKTFSMFEKGLGLGAVAMQPVYVGGQIVNGNKLASLGVEAARLQSDLVCQSVVLQTEESYWLVVSLQEKMKTLDKAQKLLDTLYKDVTTAHEAGLLLQNDVLKVQLKRNELISTHLKLERGLVLAKNALGQSIGLYPQQNDFQLTDTLIDNDILTSNSLFVEPAQAVSQRREAALLDMNVRAKQLQRAMTVGKALPQLMIGAGCSYGNLLGKQTKYNGLAFATLQLPLTAWWETAHKLHEQDLYIAQAENEQRDLTQKMALQTQQAWDDLRDAEKQVALADEAVAMAAENMKIANDNYQAGLVSLSDLLEAQAVHRQAVDQQCDAKIACKIKTTRYKQLISKR